LCTLAWTPALPGGHILLQVSASSTPHFPTLTPSWPRNSREPAKKQLIEMRWRTTCKVTSLANTLTMTGGVIYVACKLRRAVTPRPFPANGARKPVKGASAAETKTERQSGVIAVYPDHASAENAVRRLQQDGISMRNLSIVGKDFLTVEKPLGFVTTGDVAKSGAKVGAWTGGLFGLLVGAAFLILPGIGPLIIAGPLAAGVLGGIEGALAGAAFGGLTGALVGLGMSWDKAIRYESEVKAGKFLVTLQDDASQIERTRSLFTASKAETAEVFGPVITPP
jgi:hypothetical protein